MYDDLSKFNPTAKSVRYLVRGFLPSDSPYYMAELERELERLTADGAEIVSILPDHEDLLVVLKVLT